MFLTKRFTAIMLIAAPVVILAGFAATPWEPAGSGTTGYLRALGGDPAQAQISALLLHFGYGLLVPMAFGLVALCRPGKLRAIGGTLAIVGGITLSGAVLVDFTDLALVETLPFAQAVETSEHATEMAGAVVFFLPGVVGFVVGIPLLAIAAWRSGAAPAFLPAGIVVANVAMFALQGPASIAGAAVLAIVLAGTGARMLMPDDSIEIVPAPAAA